MRSRFDEQLAQLHRELIEMGALCEEAIGLATRALLEGSAASAEKAVAVDAEIDQKEREIEQLCIKLLLKQQPVARDLRVISAALKMISDMERIGDQAADISEITKYIRKNDSKSKVHIADMAKATGKMVTDSIDSFVKKDLELAYSVMRYDDVVDDLFSAVRRELIGLIGEDGRNGELCIDLLMVAKYFERIGDHAVNIAEWVEFSLTGKHTSNEGV